MIVFNVRQEIILFRSHFGSLIFKVIINLSLFLGTAASPWGSNLSPTLGSTCFLNSFEHQIGLLSSAYIDSAN